MGARIISVSGPQKGTNYEKIFSAFLRLSVDEDGVRNPVLVAQFVVNLISKVGLRSPASETI